MKNLLRVGSIAILLVLQTISPGLGQPRRLPDPIKTFAVSFQQDGQLLPIEQHEVILKKKAFSILVYLPQPTGILVNASLDPTTFEQTRAGKPLEDLQGFADLGMAEEAFNPKTLLMLSTTAPHYWYYANASDHRFNHIARQNDLWVCHRIIAQVMYRDTTRKLVDVQDMREDAIYLVFMKTEWTQDFSRQLEKQREYVKIRFR
jgi:hypothetical protein